MGIRINSNEINILGKMKAFEAAKSFEEEVEADIRATKLLDGSSSDKAPEAGKVQVWGNDTVSLSYDPRSGRVLSYDRPAKGLRVFETPGATVYQKVRPGNAGVEKQELRFPKRTGGLHYSHTRTQGCQTIDLLA